MSTATARAQSELSASVSQPAEGAVPCSNPTASSPRVPIKRANIARKPLNSDRKLRCAVEDFLAGQEFGWTRRHYGLSDRQLERGIRAAYQVRDRGLAACAGYLKSAAPVEWVDWSDEQHEMEAEIWADVQTPLLRERRIPWGKVAAGSAALAVLVIALIPGWRAAVLTLLIPAGRIVVRRAPQIARAVVKAAPRVIRFAGRHWEAIGTVALGFTGRRGGRKAEA